jgi:peptidoglycan/LPS O-acetylase OafA/YrhL
MPSKEPSVAVPPPGAHVPALDGVRGVAILMVLVLHLTTDGGIEPTIALDRLFCRLAMLGWGGVDLFFVLSGYLITGILYDTKGGAHFLRNFYVRRFLRIFPLYYGFLALWFVVLPRLYTWPEGFQTASSPLWSWAYLTNVLQALQRHLGAAPTYTGHFWSLAVEEQFYIFWQIVVLLCRRRSLMRLCLASLGGSLLVRLGLVLAGNELAAYVLTPARMDTLGVGAFLALAARGPHGLARFRRWAWPVAAVAAMAFVAVLWIEMPPPYQSLLVRTVGYTVLACLFGALLILAVTSTPEAAMGRIFGHPSLTFFGRYSYALYIFHLPVAFFVERHLFSVRALPTLMHSQLPGQLVFS